MDNIESALDAFRDSVGHECVVTDPETRTRYQTATFRTEHAVPAIVFPGNREEVQACLRVANRYEIPVYPISTGRNVGYGSRVPTTDGCVVLELSRIDRIVELNEELAMVTLEPGVTQQQLFDYLQERGSKLWMDATGSFTNHSIIGNIAERGFGHTPYGDHFAHVGGMEVVLPNGDCIHTGFGRYPGAKAKGVYRWGVGPYVDGLFTQSNLGIITQLTLWLMPAPDYFQKFYFSVDEYSQLETIVDLLRPLRLDGTLRSAIHIGNDVKVLSTIQGYPWDKAFGKTPLPSNVLSDLAHTREFSIWNATGALYGSRQQVRLARRRLKKTLSGKVNNLRFLDERTLRIAERIKKPIQKLTGIDLPQMLKLLKPVFGLTKGVPTDDFIPSTYWRKKDDVPDDPDPDRDGCGVLWLGPVAPMQGRHALEIWRITEATLTQGGFEPAVSITLLTERAMECVISITFDRNMPGEDERALACHELLLQRLTAVGYIPYRLGLASMGRLPVPEPGYASFMDVIKRSLDPAGILAPGRYEERGRPSNEGAAP